MVSTITITIDDDLKNSTELIAITKKRELSKLITQLLRSHLNVKKIALPDDIINIDDELQQINIRRAMLLNKKDSIEKAAKEEAGKWRDVF